MKKLFFLSIFCFVKIQIFAQSIELSPTGPINLKIGNFYSTFSPPSPDNKLFIYNRDSETAGLTLLDSAADGSHNFSQIYTKAGGMPSQGFFIGNYADSPLVLFNSDENQKNLFITPNGSIGIGSNKYGLDGTQKLFGKLSSTGLGDSLYSFNEQLPALVGIFSNATGPAAPNTLRIGVAGLTDGKGNSSTNVINIGVLGEASSKFNGISNGIGVLAQSFLETEGYSIGVNAKSKNLGSGTAFGLNVESFSQNGATFGINSISNGDFLNYGIYSRIVTKSGSVSPSYAFYANTQNASNDNAIYGYYADISKISGNSTAYGSYNKVDASTGSNAVGTYNIAKSTGNLSYGVQARAEGTAQNYGLYAYADGGTINYAVFGKLEPTAGPSDYAGLFEGNVHVNGVLSKSSGTFKIDHPQDPENKTLSHSFVESPEMMNIYNGNITTDQNGNAVISLPSYFEALNENFRYQLTVIGQFAQAIISEKIKGNAFKVKTDKPNVEISWMVTGTRKDAFAKKHPIIVEQEKSDTQKGKYLNPEAFGKKQNESMFD